MSATPTASSSSSCVLLQALVGHTDSINILLYTDPYLISASDDGTIRLWTQSANSSGKYGCIRAYKVAERQPITALHTTHREENRLFLWATTPAAVYCTEILRTDLVVKQLKPLYVRDYAQRQLTTTIQAADKKVASTNNDDDDSTNDLNSIVVDPKEPNLWVSDDNGDIRSFSYALQATTSSDTAAPMKISSKRVIASHENICMCLLRTDFCQNGKTKRFLWSGGFDCHMKLTNLQENKALDFSIQTSSASHNPPFIYGLSTDLITQNENSTVVVASLGSGDLLFLQPDPNIKFDSPASPNERKPFVIVSADPDADISPTPFIRHRFISDAHSMAATAIAYLGNVQIITSTTNKQLSCWASCGNDRRIAIWIVDTYSPEFWGIARDSSDGTTTTGQSKKTSSTKSLPTKEKLKQKLAAAKQQTDESDHSLQPYIKPIFEILLKGKPTAIAGLLHPISTPPFIIHLNAKASDSEDTGSTDQVLRIWCTISNTISMYDIMLRNILVKHPNLYK